MKTPSVQNSVEHNMPMKDYFVTLYVYQAEIGYISMFNKCES